MVTLDKKQRRKEKKRGWWKLVPLLHAALFFGLYLLAILVYMKIWFNAPKLRFFFVPVVCLYYSMLAAIGYWFCTRTERLKERELMGDEWFFKTYPIERWLNGGTNGIAAVLSSGSKRSGKSAWSGSAGGTGNRWSACRWRTGSGS